MNKKILVAVLALGVLGASNAFATRARVLTMGDGFATGGADGSYFYDDAHNVFYNPAYINDFKNWATIEKSNGNATAGNGPAQGGFATSMHGFNLGMYFNRVSAVSDANYNSTGMRPIDFIIGGDMGWKWGASFTFSNFKGANDTSDTDGVLKLGASVSDFEPFLHYRVLGIQNIGGGNGTGKNKMLGFGLRYHWGEWTPVVAYKSRKFEAAGVDTGGVRNLMLGLGRNMKLAEGFRLNYMAAITRQTADDVASSNITRAPLTMNVEGDVASWITARGGFTYFLLARQNGASQSVSTTARLGATFHLGKADLDWVWGQGVAATTEAGSNVDTQVMDLNGIFTAASLTYRW